MNGVRCGIDNLDSVSGVLRNRRIGLLVGSASTDRELESSVDVLRERFTVCALFAPEHGLYGSHGAGSEFGSTVDVRTGLPVHSLYGENRAPTAEQLEGLDAVVIDLQDAGARYYTYLSTLSLVMKACAGAEIPVVVLDRPNPLGGEIIEGPLLSPGFDSFVGLHRVPVRYGLTIGEYARYIDETEGYGCDLTVVPLEGWKRSMYFDETGLQWVPPSPNLPTAESAIVYVGTCLFEGTNVSEGRGTAKPFEVFGAPWIEPRRVAERIDQAALAGGRLRECRFEPSASKYHGETCAGFQLHVTDRRIFRPYGAGAAVIDAVRAVHPEFRFLEPEDRHGRYFIDLLSGNELLRAVDFTLCEYIGRCDRDAAEFAEMRNRVLLYNG